MTDWWRAPDTLLAQAWSLLARGVADRRAPARHPVLATVNPEGWADARTVVLRAASAESALLTVHSDAASTKVASLRKTPGCTLLVWDAKAHLQIRVLAQARITTGDARAWDRIPPGAQRVYGGTPPPGAPLTAPEEHSPVPDPERFAILECQAVAIDLLHLGQDQHRRARFTREADWHGAWIAP